MSDQPLSSQDAMEALSKLKAFAASAEMEKLEQLLRDKNATIEQVSALLPAELLHVAMQLIVAPERFRLPDSWPMESKLAYQQASIAYSDRFAPLKDHPAVRFFFASLAQKAKRAKDQEGMLAKIEHSVFKPIGSVWDHEFWLESEEKLSPMCRVSFHSPENELLLESTCDLQELTFLARRFLQMIQEGLERSIPWAGRGLVNIPFQEDVTENIADIEEAVAAIREHAAKLGILSRVKD